MSSKVSQVPKVMAYNRKELLEPLNFWNFLALVVKLVDTQDLKSCGPQGLCGFNSRLGH